jgi:methylated-DNA-[protein]-cysteine S-methyltransferase
MNKSQDISDERGIEAAIAAGPPDAAPLDLDSAAAELAARADRDGLVEVAYTEAESPIGTLLLAATEVGLVAVGWSSTDRDRLLEELAERIGPRVIEAPARLDPVRTELDSYFEGRLRRFESPLDWRLSRGFRREILNETARIPFGQTLSYAEIAKRAGSPRAHRAAGSALGANPIPIIVPCHRVLRSDGGLGGYGGGLDVKRQLLRLEGALE